MIEPLPIPAGAAVLDLMPRLARALAGEGPVRPYAANTPPGRHALTTPQQGPERSHRGAELPARLAVVVGTSGSTGTPKLAMLTAPALAASADATHERIGGPGQWLLALPAHHIAGLQVLLRSIRAGTTPIVQDLADGFDTAEFTAAVGTMDPSGPRYASLVPVQLTRILDDEAATRAAASLSAILLGGQAIDPRLRERAAARGIRTVATYGMSETGGGCVYDGRPLPGVRVAIDEADGRISLGGAVLASGYLGDAPRTETAFHGEGDQRWFRTDDHGHLDDEGRLHVDGRLDDLINSGGLKVAPRHVEEALRTHVPDVLDACVVGVPDPDWGEVVAAAVVLATPSRGAGGSLSEVRSRLRGILPDHALPQRVRVVVELPMRGPGKPDRRLVRAILTMGQ